MRIDVFTIFPEYLAPLELSLIGKARQKGLVDLSVADLRDFTHDRHRTVDDTPYGGGAGMVMRPEPWGEALDSVLMSDAVPSRGGDTGPGGESDPGGDAVPSGDSVPAGDEHSPVLLVPSPAGTPFTQELARELAREPHLLFACGRYEGIDQRVVDHAATRTRVRMVSLGDYVLNGGEVAAMAMIEAIVRLIPGVVGNPESLVEESHETGTIEYPVYTKPAVWRERAVPDILLSGNHAAIARWRRERSLERTALGRPDLVAALDPTVLDAGEHELLAGLGYREEDGRLRRHAANGGPAPDGGVADRVAE